jgi:hypothetical protein
MLTLTQGFAQDRHGLSRRELLRIGSLGLAGLTLPGLLRAKALGASVGAELVKDRSVVLLWLGGGPSHIETFDPKMTAPVEIRSVTGERKSSDGDVLADAIDNAIKDFQQIRRSVCAANL